MHERPIRPLAALLLALVVGLAGCDAISTPVEPIDAPNFSTQVWLGLVTTTDTTGNAVVQVVGRNGGQIYVGDHSLFIPRGAVSEDTEFTFSVVGDGYVHVELSAKRVSDGATVTTFDSPLYLRLSYKNANVSNPYALTNVFLAEGSTDGALEPLPSYVSQFTQTVSSPLTHFSGYAMGMN